MPLEIHRNFDPDSIRIVQKKRASYAVGYTSSFNRKKATIYQPTKNWVRETGAPNLGLDVIESAKAVPRKQQHVWSQNNLNSFISQKLTGADDDSGPVSNAKMQKLKKEYIVHN